MAVSEVTQLRQQIAAEYMAAQWGLSGLAQGTARHQVIALRMERMEAGHQALRNIVGETAMALIAETLEAIPEQPTRVHVREMLQQELGESEETAQMLDGIDDLWDTVDQLQARFGAEGARKIVSARSCVELRVMSS